MTTSDLITVDPKNLRCVSVFKGTRVPVKLLFNYLADNYCLDEFLECFPSVTREHACQVLEHSNLRLTASLTPPRHSHKPPAAAR